MDAKFNLGQEVRDTLTGYQGVVYCRTDYMTGCVRYGLQSRELSEEGQPRDLVYFDEMQLEAVDATVARAPGTGGPRSAPRHTPNPR